MASQASDQARTMPVTAAYISPPDHHLESFYTMRPNPTLARRAFIANGGGPSLPPVSTLLQTASPPISPTTKTEKEQGKRDSACDISVRDPLLFPDESLHSGADVAQPLFHSNENTHDAAQRAHLATCNAKEYAQIRTHIKNRQSLPAGVQGPSVDDYRLVAGCFGRYSRDAKSYIKQELALLDAYPPRFPRPQEQKAQAPVISRKRKAVADISPADTPVKKRAAAVKPSGEKPTPPKRARAAKPSPGVPVTDAYGTYMDHEDFSAIVDWCPTTENLDNSPKALYVEWKGTPSNLANDSNRHLLHPAELKMASTLRLNCAQYLFNKRRIFVGWRKSVLDEKEFKTTHVQQACKIDVNKATQYFHAFTRAGWFNPKHMRAEPVHTAALRT